MRNDLFQHSVDYEKNQFDILRVREKVRVPLVQIECRRNDEFPEMVVDILMKYAAGNQVRKLKHSESKILKTSVVPKTWLDLCKDAITKFSPTLRFGWLIPEYEFIPLTALTTEYAEYLNVYPLPHQAFAYEDYTCFNELIPNSIEWLCSEPPSKNDIRDARTRIRLTADELALAMSIESQPNLRSEYKFKTTQAQKLFWEAVYIESTHE